MGTAQTIARNTGFLVSSYVLQKMLSFVLVIFIARLLLPEEFGIYSFVFSFTALFSMVAAAGLGVYAVREISRRPADSAAIVGDVSVIRLFTSIAAVALAMLFAFALGYKPFTILLVFVASLSMFFDSLANLFKNVFQAFQRMEFEFYSDTVYKIILVALSIAALFLDYKLLVLFLILLAAGMLRALVNFLITILKLTKISIKINMKTYREIFIISLPFTLILFLTSIYSEIDTVMISILRNPLEVAYYSVATRLTDSLGFLSAAFMSAVFPVMAQFFSQKNRSFSLVLRKSLDYLLILVLPIGFGTMVLADRLILLFFGSEYLAGTAALQIVIWVSMLSFLTAIFSEALISAGKEKIIGLVILVSVLFNIFFNALLIPVYGFVGAAATSLASEILLLGLDYHYIAKYVSGTKALELLIRPVAKPLAASITMCLLIFVLYPFSLYLVIPAAAVFYFAMILLMRTFSREDIELFGKLTGNKLFRKLLAFIEPFASR